ncbi:hypothetical protein Tco_1358593 [Tanacetum coccineum]
MVVLVRLQICEELDDTWAWVAPRPERQPDATIGTLEVAKGAQAGPAPVQAPQPPPVAVPAWSLPQRVARLEEEVHGIQGALGEQREVLDSIAHDFSRFATWTVTSLSQMMDHAVVRYTSYSDFQILYVRCVRHKTDDANTLAPQQPDP